MKLSTDSIQGFAEMSDAEKVTALLGLDVPDPVDLSGYVKKEVFDAKATEAANLSKQLRGKMTEDETKKAEEEQARQALETKYQELLKKSTVAEHTARYLALGYEEKLARDTAEALFDGNMERVFENQKKFNEAREKQLRAELVKKDPRPDGAGSGGEKARSDVEFAKSLAERRAASRKEAEEAMKYYI